MFENAKARFAKLEEDHEAVRNIKQHVEKYQTVYAAVGASGLTLVAVKLFGKPQVIVKGSEALPSIVNTVAPVFNNHNIGNHLVNNVGHCTKIVQDVETEKLWPKASALAAELAEKHGVSFETARTLLSKHLNGHTDHVFGKQYMTYGLGTTG
jgi:hypothetical protein